MGTGTSPPPTPPGPSPSRYVNVFDELSESERDEVLRLALGEEHTRELPRKVQAALEADYDEQQGVHSGAGGPRKDPPLQANLDLWSHHARQALQQGDFTRAENLYRQCIEYSPVDGRSWLGLARIAAKKGQTDVAEKCFRDGLYYSPKVGQG